MVFRYCVGVLAHCVFRTLCVIVTVVPHRAGPATLAVSAVWGQIIGQLVVAVQVSSSTWNRTVAMLAILLRHFLVTLGSLQIGPMPGNKVASFIATMLVQYY